LKNMIFGKISIQCEVKVVSALEIIDYLVNGHIKFFNWRNLVM
jgi:hypothetical protein